MDSSEIAFLPATEAATLIRRRELSAVEVLEAAFRQYEAINPTVNALVTPDWEQARQLAQHAEQAVLSREPLGPLHGLPIGIKDLTLTAGLRTTFGSTLYADNVPEVDSLVITRLKAAGGIIVGKTNTPEFGFGMNTRNAVFGTTVNPWNTALTCGRVPVGTLSRRPGLSEPTSFTALWSSTRRRSGRTGPVCRPSPADGSPGQAPAAEGVRERREAAARAAARGPP